MSNIMEAIVMAGGEGKRMKSTLPKVLHPVCGHEMIYLIVKKVIELGVKTVYIVCGKHKDAIMKCIDTKVKTNFPNAVIHYVMQETPLGTGHAIMQCLPYIKSETMTDIMILNGDAPLIDNTIREFMNIPSPALMVTSLKNPKGQGRIITSNSTGKFQRIVEEKDANEEERQIQLVNCGVYKVSNQDLTKYVPQITNHNAQKEYYLTDLCEFIQDKLNLYEVKKEDQIELLNVNSQEDLCKANRAMIETTLKDMNFQIRKVLPDDFSKGYTSLLAQLSDTIDINTPAQFEELLNTIQQNKNHHIYVVEDLSTKTIIGNITLLIEPKFIHGGQCVGHIEDVVVHKCYRNKKIGAYLVNYINTFIFEYNCYKFILDCKDYLIPFYTQSGYNFTDGVQMHRYI